MQTLLRSSDAYRNEWTWAGAKRGEASTKTSLARNQKRDSSLTRHHEFHFLLSREKRRNELRLFFKLSSK